MVQALRWTKERPEKLGRPYWTRTGGLTATAEIVRISGHSTNGVLTVHPEGDYGDVKPLSDMNEPDREWCEIPIPVEPT